MLLNASKDYRRERKERRQNATRQETRTPEDEDDGENGWYDSWLCGQLGDEVT